jgi:DNA topoisomerase IB
VHPSSLNNPKEKRKRKKKAETFFTSKNKKSLKKSLISYDKCLTSVIV